MPDLVMVTYEAPDTIGATMVELDELPSRLAAPGKRDAAARRRLAPIAFDAAACAFPRRSCRCARSPDLNVLINHDHADAAAIKTVASEPFALDPRLF